MTKHYKVDHLTELKTGDFVLVKGQWAEIYVITEENGINTSRGWICRSELNANWQPDPEIKPWIVCAANRHKETGVIFCGARHFDNAMRGQIKAANYPFTGYEQGFIDQFSRFYNRKEAWIIAETNGQIKRISGTKGTLYSEDVW
jgi:hypothetical protein